MPEGIITFFLSDKGYGYVRIPETREEFFVSQKQTQELLQKGDRVRFTIKENKQGQFAIEVQKLVKRD
ncbi:MAG: cold shock domain-containing protein [Bacteroidota bacterium]